MLVFGPRTCVLSSDLCSVPRPVFCPQTCVLSSDPCSVIRPVFGPQTCVLSSDLCSVLRPVFCHQTRVRSSDLCSVLRPVFCPQTCVLSSYLCSLLRPVFGPQTCVLSSDLCSVLRPVFCHQTCVVSSDLCSLLRPVFGPQTCVLSSDLAFGRGGMTAAARRRQAMRRSEKQRSRSFDLILDTGYNPCLWSPVEDRHFAANLSPGDMYVYDNSGLLVAVTDGCGEGGRRRTSPARALKVTDGRRRESGPRPDSTERRPLRSKQSVDPPLSDTRQRRMATFQEARSHSLDSSFEEFQRQFAPDLVDSGVASSGRLSAKQRRARLLHEKSYSLDMSYVAHDVQLAPTSPPMATSKLAPAPHAEADSRVYQAKCSQEVNTPRRQEAAKCSSRGDAAPMLAREKRAKRFQQQKSSSYEMAGDSGRGPAEKARSRRLKQFQQQKSRSCDVPHSAAPSGDSRAAWIAPLPPSSTARTPSVSQSEKQHEMVMERLAVPSRSRKATRRASPPSERVAPPSDHCEKRIENLEQREADFWRRKRLELFQAQKSYSCEVTSQSVRVVAPEPRRHSENVTAATLCQARRQAYEARRQETIAVLPTRTDTTAERREERRKGGGRGAAFNRTMEGGGHGAASNRTAEGGVHGAAFNRTAESGGHGAAFNRTAEGGVHGAAFNRTAEGGGHGAAPNRTAESGGHGAAFNRTAEGGGHGAAPNRTAESGGHGAAFNRTAEGGGHGAAPNRTAESGGHGAAFNRTAEGGGHGAAPNRTAESGGHGTAPNRTAESGVHGAASNRPAEGHATKKKKMMLMLHSMKDVKITEAMSPTESDATGRGEAKRAPPGSRGGPSRTSEADPRRVALDFNNAISAESRDSATNRTDAATGGLTEQRRTAQLKSAQSASTGKSKTEMSAAKRSCCMRTEWSSDYNEVDANGEALVASVCTDAARLKPSKAAGEV